MCILSAGIFKKNMNKNNTDAYPAHKQKTRQRERGERVRGKNLRQFIWYAVPEILGQEP
jgi:hypothetical protein